MSYEATPHKGEGSMGHGRRHHYLYGDMGAARSCLLPPSNLQGGRRTSLRWRLPLLANFVGKLSRRLDDEIEAAANPTLPSSDVSDNAVDVADE